MHKFTIILGAAGVLTGAANPQMMRLRTMKR